MSNSIKLNKEKRFEMINSIKEYFFNNENEELGDLRASLLLDFFLEELAPEIYNEGISMCYSQLSSSLEDLFALQIRKR
ncbi:DUF2164 family protein [Clostridium hydrogeniformans]|uniref:DUF2164 family protein n=1 Tax=Clostridium hydrogeniformans TaxID=349933 RepID=UPI000A567ACE|nr:DUF2164 family protein [Clostridium hydrogeniformans]